MRVPAGKLGELTADHLARKLRGEPVAERIEFEAEIVPRASVGPPPVS